MTYTVYSRISKNRLQRARQFQRETYEKTLESIENDDEFIKLYNITVQKYLDNGDNPNDITILDIISLDIEYFTKTYGTRFSVEYLKDKKIDFYQF